MTDCRSKIQNIEAGTIDGQSIMEDAMAIIAELVAALEMERE